MSGPSTELVMRIARVLRDTVHHTNQAERARQIISAFQPGDEVREGLQVIDLVDYFRQQNAIMRKTRADARQKGARQAAGAMQETCALEAGNWIQGFASQETCQALTNYIRTLDTDKILETKSNRG